MFPSFTSLADREHKRIELLEKVQRRVRQNNAKRSMYAEAAWATDADKTFTATKRATQDSSDQTDEGLLKKPVVIENSERSAQTQQEHQGIDAKVDNGIQVEPSVSNNGVQVEPDVVDNAIQAIPSVTSSGSQYEPNGKDSETQTHTNTLSEVEEQAKEWIEKLFISNANWVALKIRPIKKNKSVDPKRYVGLEGKTYSLKTNRLSGSKYIDWVKTANYISNIHYNAESNSVDEVGVMRDNDTDARYYSNIKGIRPAEDQLDRGHHKFQTTYDVYDDKITDTSTDEREAQSKLWFMIKTYKKKLIGSNIIVRPVLKDGSILNSAEVIIDNKGYLNVKNNSTNKQLPSQLYNVSWIGTLQNFNILVRERGLSFKYEPKKAMERGINPYQAVLSHPAPSDSTVNQEEVRKLGMAAADAKRFITDYFKAAYEDRTKIVPIRLKPIAINRKNEIATSQPYYLSWFVDPDGVGSLRVRNENTKNHAVVSPSNTNQFFKNVKWTYTLDALIEVIDELSSHLTSQLDEEQRKRIEFTINLFNYIALAHQVHFKEKTVNVADADIEDFANRQADRETHHEVKNLMNDMLNKASGSGLKGRGLTGAGLDTSGLLKGGRSIPNKKPKGTPVYQTGIQRSGNGRYNLNDIQGTALASAFIYKQIGSKYIRIPELNNNVLYIVRPSREKMGPRRDISKAITEMIKDLVYNQNISQAAYDQLTVEDQKLFKEILRITHIQHAFRDELPDPLGNLKMEYDKLKGEVMLGNDNPDILKQLKIVTVDMYSNKLIGDNEFKDIITRLIS